MNQKIEQLYQEIGKEALNKAGALAGRLLIYAEAEDGVISTDVFYVNQAGVVQFKFGPKPLKTLIYSLWEQWKQIPGNREWRVMCYLINDGEFTFDLTYPDQINEDEDVSDRRPRAIKQYFGDMKVDYSKPS